MTWTNIPDTNIEPGKPVRSIDMIAMRDNIPALANGDAGAPRITSKAIVRALELSAGNNIQSSLDVEQSITDTSWQPVYSTSFSTVFFGSIRFYVEHKTSGGSASSVRFLKNGAVLATFTTSGTSYIARTFDTTLASGDVLTIQASASQSTYVRNCRLLVERPAIVRTIPVYVDEDGIYA
jgi:hypothetical protein